MLPSVMDDKYATDAEVRALRERIAGARLLVKDVATAARITRPHLSALLNGTLPMRRYQHANISRAVTKLEGGDDE